MAVTIYHEQDANPELIQVRRSPLSAMALRVMLMR